MLLGFLPFVVFALASGSLGATTALALGAATSGALLVRGRLRRESFKLLEAGTFGLLVLLALYAWFAHRPLSLFGVRVCVDAGLSAIILASLLVGRPFTLQYAREHVAPAVWQTPRFVRTNIVMTTAWLVAFVVLTVAEAVIVFVPGFPSSFGIAVCVVALLGAGAFTVFYPKHVRSASKGGF